MRVNVEDKNFQKISKHYLKIEKTVKTKQSYWETLANIICDF